MAENLKKCCWCCRSVDVMSWQNRTISDGFLSKESERSLCDGMCSAEIKETERFS